MSFYKIEDYLAGDLNLAPSTQTMSLNRRVLLYSQVLEEQLIGVV